MWTLNGFGSHFDQTLGHRSFRAFKFVNRHGDSFPERHSPLPFLTNSEITPPDTLCQLEYFTDRKGQRIIKEGATGAWIYILVHGRVEIIKDGRIITTTDRRGELIGEIGAIDGAARSASVMASENTVCLAIDTRQIQRMTGDDRLAFGYILYREFAETRAERLRLTTQELMRERNRFHLKKWLPGGR